VPFGLGRNVSAHPFQRQAPTICDGAAGETQLQNDVHGADEAAWRLDDRAVKFLGRDDLEVVLLDEETMERAFGWAFFFNSKLFVKTGDIRYIADSY
jgi:hypothetical protein